MFFAAIDLGATYIKSCRIDCGSSAISHVLREKFPSFASQNAKAGDRVLSLAEILKTVVSILERQTVGECTGILFSNQMHGLVLMQNGSAISPFISWQDLRSIRVLDEIRSRMEGFVFQKETGEFLRAGFPVAQLFALKSEGIKSGVVCDLGNAIVQSLSGEKNSKMDVTNAAATGAWDIQNSSWHSSLIEDLDLKSFTWPDVVKSDQVVGYWTRQGRKIPVYTSVGDQQISLLGAGLSKRDQVCFNIATGSQVSRLVEKPNSGDYQIRPYFDDQFLRTITHIPAGRSLNRLMNLFIEMNPSTTLDQAWEIVGSKVDDDSNGQSAPYVDLSFFPSAFGEEGKIEGLLEDNLNVVALMRGAFGSIVRMHLQGLDRIGVGESKSQGYLGAGGILRKSKYLRELFRRELGQELALPELGEDALQGLAMRAQNLN